MSDDDVKDRARIEQADRIVTVIWISMMVGVLTLSGVGFGIGPKEPGPGVDAGLMSMIFLGMGVSMAMPCVVVRALRDRAFGKAATLAEGIARYQQLAIASIAMAEGIGLLGGVSLIMGLPIYVASVLVPVSLGLLMINKPSMREGAAVARFKKDMA